MKSIVSVGIVMFLLLPSLPVESNDNIKRNNLVNDMVERRKKSGKEMKVTMDEFWKELKETREIKRKRNKNEKPEKKNREKLNINIF